MDGSRFVIEVAPAWGRDVLGVGDMWNANSLISWLLIGIGIDTAHLSPPFDGVAPGWATGLAVGRAQPDAPTGA